MNINNKINSNINFSLSKDPKNNNLKNINIFTNNQDKYDLKKNIDILVNSVDITYNIVTDKVTSAIDTVAAWFDLDTKANIKKSNEMNEGHMVSNLTSDDYVYVKNNLKDILYNKKYLYSCYGGNQSAPLNGYLNGDDWYETIIRKYFPDINDKEVYDYLNAMNNVGCGYVATCNYIMESYADNPEQFEKDFGYPIAYKTSNGEIFSTINYLFCDLYCYVYKNNIIEPDETNSIVNFFDLIMKSETYSFNGSSKRNTGTTVEDRNTILDSNKFKNLNIDLKVLKEYYGTSNPNINYYSLVKSEIEKGNVVSLSATNYTLYYTDSDNNIVTSDGRDPIIMKNAPHAMTITDVTDDGNYVVSTWGDKYILDIKSLDNTYGLDLIVRK